VENICGAGQTTDDKMAQALCMMDNEATNKHSQYVILIVFPLLQWLHEQASMLRITYVATCSKYSFIMTSLYLVYPISHRSAKRSSFYPIFC
jgi:hypothetical protein